MQCVCQCRSILHVFLPKTNYPVPDPVLLVIVTPAALRVKWMQHITCKVKECDLHQINHLILFLCSVCNNTPAPCLHSHPVSWHSFTDHTPVVIGHLWQWNYNISIIELRVCLLYFFKCTFHACQWLCIEMTSGSLSISLITGTLITLYGY